MRQRLRQGSGRGSRQLERKKKISIISADSEVGEAKVFEKG